MLHAEGFPVSERTLVTKQMSKTLSPTLNAKAKGIPASLLGDSRLDVDQMGSFCVSPLEGNKTFTKFFFTS